MGSKEGVLFHHNRMSKAAKDRWRRFAIDYGCFDYSEAGRRCKMIDK